MSPAPEGRALFLLLTNTKLWIKFVSMYGIEKKNNTVNKKTWLSDKNNPRHRACLDLYSMSPPKNPGPGSAPATTAACAWKAAHK